MRSEKQKKVLAGIFLTALVFMFAGCGNTEELRLGAAAVGGMYHKAAGTYADMVQLEKTASMEVKDTAGSAANLRLLEEGYIDLGIVQADLIQEDQRSEKNAEGGTYSAIAALYTEPCQIIVRADSDISSVDDLQGKILSLGESESGSEKNAEQILTFCGLTEELFTKVSLNYSEAAGKLASGEIDAMFCTVGVPADIVSELAQTCGIRLLPLDETCIQRVCEVSPSCYETVIPAGTYDGQEEDVRTIGTKAVLLASNRISDKMVQQLTEVLFVHAADLEDVTAMDSNYNAAEAVEGVPVPFHPGAAAYYASQGISVNSAK